MEYKGGTIMKSVISLVLVMATVLSLTACGGCAPVETTVPAAVPATTAAATEPTAEPATEPTTEPTVSPEKMLYASLPDRMKQAVDVDIVELSQLEDLSRTVTVGEASEMLQKAYVHRTGTESKNLIDLINTPEYAQRDADHYWIWNIPGQLDMELGYGDAYKNRKQWITFISDVNKNGLLWWSFAGRLGLGGNSFIEGEDAYRNTNKLPDYSLTDAEWETMMDLMFSGDGGFYGPDKPSNNYVVINGYGNAVYDSTNGRRFNRLVDGNMHPTKALTVAEAAEQALIYYNYPNPMDDPSFVAPEAVGAYNGQIITRDLLEKETDLPAASCESLPSGWHGVVMDDMQLIFPEGHMDNNIYEYEIQKVKEAGFNYIGLELDFNWLQDLILFEKRPGYKDAYGSSKDRGKLSVERLEMLDRVLALCMKYDIHLNLRATGVGGYAEINQQVFGAEKDKNLGKSFPALWQAIARRYADIPNEYLSFTLFTGIHTKLDDDTLLPAVDAIRLESPERCIIADIYHSGMKSAKYAQKGVALSYRLGKDDCAAFELDPMKIVKNVREEAKWYKAGKDFVKNFTWPYGDAVNALTVLDSGKGETCQMVMNTAAEYGVGFMLGEFGVTYTSEPDGRSLEDKFYPCFRYADEPYFAMITDITSTMEALGYGWCFAHWYGPYGIAFSIPAIQTSTYEQVEDYPCYIDQGMMNLFKTINQ